MNYNEILRDEPSLMHKKINYSELRWKINMRVSLRVKVVPIIRK